MRLPRVRSTVRGMMLVCLYVAICLASLLSPSQFTADFLYTVQICLLFTSVLGVALRRQAERAFWLGFAVFGWGYLFLTYLTWWGGAPPLMYTSRLMHRLLPPWLPLQGVDGFYASCASIENVIFACVGGSLGLLLAPDQSDRGCP